jgi:hypothetical protein
MKRHVSRAVGLALFVAFVAACLAVYACGETRPEKEPPAELLTLRPLLTKYCGACHGETKPRAGLDVGALLDPDRPVDLSTLKKVWERLKNQHMPPAGQPQPSAPERERISTLLETLLARNSLGGHPDPGPMRTRRLNVREYMNSLRDLTITRHPQVRRLSFGNAAPDGRIRLNSSQPENLVAFVERMLPVDTRDGGFDTIGENLSIPPFLMEKYLRCTRVLLDEVFSANAKSGGDFAGPWHLRGKLDRLTKGPLPKNATLRSELAVLLRDLASSAFRRPVTLEEVEKYAKLYDLAQEKGEDFEASVRLPIQAILVSPRFVLLWGEPESKMAGPPASPVRPLDSYELAARLSYFLWSSVPDPDLQKVAAAGRLNDPRAIEEQVRRMLKDRRAWPGLVEGFVWQWLHLDRLERAAPDAEHYPGYFKNNLAELEKRELTLFTEVLTYEDRSILEFLDADWGFLCQPLAELYDIPDFPGKKNRDTWYRWKFTDKRRGGVLTMGLVLTGTSHPLRTSPVARGKWLLETVLGTPPPPPPPEVDNVLKEAPPGANLTVRQRMERHRADPACASCHRLIDPLGLAFETYDPVGRWRDKDVGQAIDPASTLADGTAIKGVEDLKALLLARKDDFTRAFVEQMLTYALGRKLEYHDAEIVREITKAVAADGYRFSRVVVEIARSYPFRHRRVEGEK